MIACCRLRGADHKGTAAFVEMQERASEVSRLVITEAMRVTRRGAARIEGTVNSARSLQECRAAWERRFGWDRSIPSAGRRRPARSLGPESIGLVR